MTNIKPSSSAREEPVQWWQGEPNPFATLPRSYYDGMTLDEYNQTIPRFAQQMRYRILPDDPDQRAEHLKQEAQSLDETYGGPTQTQESASASLEPVSLGLIARLVDWSIGLGYHRVISRDRLIADFEAIHAHRVADHEAKKTDPRRPQSRRRSRAPRRPSVQRPGSRRGSRGPLEQRAEPGRRLGGLSRTSRDQVEPSRRLGGHGRSSREQGEPSRRLSEMAWSWEDLTGPGR